MKVRLKKNAFTAELNAGPISVVEFEARQGKVHIAPGEYAIFTEFGEMFAVTEADFEKYFEEKKPEKKKAAAKKEKK